MKSVVDFQKTLWEHYAHNKRDLPWRPPSLKLRKDKSLDPYKILVSEMMLQQTQVARVVAKYAQFLEAFPTIQSLARAPLADVLIMWRRLGYNRRARFLHETAKLVVRDFNGHVPAIRTELMRLPGIGGSTAAAVVVYAYNQPEAFVETNIRSVYLQHFFAGQNDVSDTQILALVEETIDTRRPREWYWALMDYGSHIKKTLGNPNSASRHYTRQSRFEGSRRQLRGEVLRQLSGQSKTRAELRKNIVDERLNDVLQDLYAEQIITKTTTGYQLG